MRIALALVALAVPAYAQAPTAPPPTQQPGPPSGPVGAPTASPPAPASDPGVPPVNNPGVDPAYGERPDPTASAPSVEDDRYLRGVRAGREIVVRYHPDRSRKNMIALGATVGAGALFGLVGVYFHLDSRSASSDVSADRFNGRPWNADHEDTYDRAHRSATIAGVMYGFGGALLLTSAVAYIVTEPALETAVIHPHTNAKPVTMVAPTRGGAIVGTGWSF